MSHLPKKIINVAEIYSEAYFKGGEYLDYTAHYLAHQKNAETKWQLIRKNTMEPLRVFELGCAYGYFLDYVRTHGAQAIHGVDVSQAAIQSARQNFGPYFSTSKESQDFNYNCFVMWDVWEHLPEPMTTVREYVKALPAGGLFAMTTVDSGSLVARLRGGRWRQIHPPTHLHYPTRKGLRLAIDSMGLEIIEHRNFSPARALEVYLQAMGLNRFVKSEYLNRLPVRLNLFDTQLLMARKV